MYVDMPDAEAASTKLKVRVTRGSKPFEKELYVGQDLRQNASNYVILTNPEQSAGVLGQRKNRVRLLPPGPGGDRPAHGGDPRGHRAASRRASVPWPGSTRSPASDLNFR